MTCQSGVPIFPYEIFLIIVDHVAPSAALPQIALQPHHPITKTLITLTYTCKALHHLARRLLYTHCLYIHTPQRLFKLLGSLTYTPVTSLVPLRGELLTHATSLYLRPFPVKDVTDSLTITEATRDLLLLLGPKLRRLLIDMPLRQFYATDAALEDSSSESSEDHPTLPLDDEPDQPAGVLRILRPAFLTFPVLEEFCSVRDELCLATRGGEDTPDWREQPAWASWPRLKTLVLHNVDVSTTSFWASLVPLQHITTIVLPSADGLWEVDIQQEWRKRFEDGEARPLTVVLVNAETEHDTPLGRDGWTEEDKLVVKQVNVPISYYGDEDLIPLCQQWIKRLFMGGSPVDTWS